MGSGYSSMLGGLGVFLALFLMFGLPAFIVVFIYLAITEYTASKRGREVLERMKNNRTN